MQNRPIKRVSNPESNEMYPPYWTPSKEGIFVRYSYEYKWKCGEIYRSGQWPEKLEGVRQGDLETQSANGFIWKMQMSQKFYSLNATTKYAPQRNGLHWLCRSYQKNRGGLPLQSRLHVAAGWSGEGIVPDDTPSAVESLLKSQHKEIVNGIVTPMAEKRSLWLW